MNKKMFLFLITALSTAMLVSCSGNLTRQPVHWTSWAPHMNQVLRQVMTGPLQGKTVVLMVDDILVKHLEGDSVLGAAATQTVIFTFPRHSEDNYTDFYRSVKPHVAVVVVGAERQGPLEHPPQWRTPRALLVLVAAGNCKFEELSRSPLLLTTPLVAVICPSPRNSTYRVLTRLASKEWARLGIWDPDAFATWDALFRDRFVDFKGQVFPVICSFDDVPLVYEKENDTLDGSNIRILNALSKWLNFRVVYSKPVNDGLWGTRKNGTWTGILGRLFRGRSVIGINYYTVTEERGEDFDYSGSYYNEGFALMLRVPPPLPRWMNLLFPYTWVVWALLAGVMVLVGLTFYLLNLRKYHLSLARSFVITIKGMVGQSVERVPVYWVSRSFLGLWWFAMLVLDISYTCNLIAVLTVPAYPSRIHTFEQLARSQYKTCMLDYGEFVPGALLASTDASLVKMGAKMELVPEDHSLRFTGEEGCVTRVVAGTHVHIETFSYLKILYRALGVNSKVYYMKPQLYRGHLAFLFKKHTPWRHKFNTGLQRLLEAGLVNKWIDEIMDAFPGGEGETREREPEELTIAHMQSSFLVLGMGAVVALVVFLVEFFQHSRPASHSSLAKPGGG